MSDHASSSVQTSAKNNEGEWMRWDRERNGNDNVFHDD